MQIYDNVLLPIIGKWKVKEGAEALVIKCSKWGHVQANHFDATKGFKLRKCNLCNCKEFKFKSKDKLKGLFQKKNLK